MYKCCIFDLDGTLLDTLEAITYTANLTLAAFGLGPIDAETYKVLIGDGAGKLIERALIRCGDDKLRYYNEAYELYQKNFKIHSMHEVKPYEGIPELLRELKEKNVKLAVLSNKPHLRTMENIETVFGTEYFAHVQGEQEPYVKRKPDPSGVYQVMESLGVTKEECLYVGDTNTDMLTGHNAGLAAAGVTWGFRDEAELKAYDADYIVHHPKELAKLF